MTRARWILCRKSSLGTSKPEVWGAPLLESEHLHTAKLRSWNDFWKRTTPFVCSLVPGILFWKVKYVRPKHGYILNKQKCWFHTTRGTQWELSASVVSPKISLQLAAPWKSPLETCLSEGVVLVHADNSSSCPRAEGISIRRIFFLLLGPQLRRKQELGDSPIARVLYSLWLAHSFTDPLFCMEMWLKR